LLVNWSSHLPPSPSALHLLPICFPFRNPDPLWFSQVNAFFTKTTSQLWFPRPAQLELWLIYLRTMLKMHNFFKNWRSSKYCRLCEVTKNFNLSPYKISLT
jgi:hypothetical protein